jgi:hypothetical protein
MKENEETEKVINISKDDTIIIEDEITSNFKKDEKDYPIFLDSSFKNEILEFDLKTREILEEPLNPIFLKLVEGKKISPFAKDCLEFYNGKYISIKYKENFDNLIFTQNVFIFTKI